jgi:hypothetical protein
MTLPLTPEQLFWAKLAVAAMTGWMVGYALVLDWAPAIIRRLRRWGRRAA